MTYNEILFLFFLIDQYNLPLIILQADKYVNTGCDQNIKMCLSEPKSSSNKLYIGTEQTLRLLAGKVLTARRLLKMQITGSI